MPVVAQKNRPVAARPARPGVKVPRARSRVGASNQLRQREYESRRPKGEFDRHTHANAEQTRGHTSDDVPQPANGLPRLLLQRSCACGQESMGTCEACRKKKKEPPLLRSSEMPAPDVIPPIVHSVLSALGRPLDGDTRAFMEARFDHDFSEVRIHDDASAAESARAVNAHAYTVGQDIVFDTDQYAPTTSAGRKLLAHELAHTIQQRGLQRSSQMVIVPPAAEEQRLEGEAHSAAMRAISGSPVSGLTYALASPRLSRTPRRWAGTQTTPFPVDITWPQLAGQLTFNVTARSLDPEANGVAFLIDAFYLPVNKRFAFDRYETRAAAGALETQLIFSTTNGSVAPARQGDDGTPALIQLWLQRTNWPPAQSHFLWHLAGGCPAPATAPAPGTPPPTTAVATAVATPTDFGNVPGKGCQVDHIMELQLGGNNIPDNMFMLDPVWNQDAGMRFTWPMLQSLGRQIRNHYYPNDPRPQEITLSFRDNLTVRGNPAQTGVPPQNPAVYDRTRCLREVFAGRATQCWQVDLCAPHLTATEIASAGGAAAPPTGTASPSRVYPLRVAEMTANVTADQRGTAEIQVPLSASVGTVTPENLPAADLISGIELTRLTVRPETSRRRGSKDLVEGVIDQRSRAARQRRTAPSMQELANEGATIRLNRQPATGAVEGAPNDTEGRLAIVNPRTAVRFHYPFLSEARMTLNVDPTNGLTGRGTLTPSVPLINRYPMNIEFGQGRLRAFYGTTPRGGRPFPGGRLTELSLGADLMPEFNPSGRVALEFGSTTRPIGNLTMEATVDENGLVLAGDLFVQIPGTDRSQGHVEYRNGQWSGFVVVESSKIRLPGFQRGELRVDFNPDGTIRPSGAVDLLILGNPVTLRAAYERNRLILTGEATVRVPHLQPVNLNLRHDGEHLTASARTGVTISGLTGTVLVNYRDGGLSGEGTLNVERGRASGTITLRISRAGNLTGQGSVRVRLTDNLIGTIGIEKPEQGPVRVSGELAFPNPIQLFQAIERRHTLFERSVEFGIPGLSIPVVNVGVVAVITGRLSVGYGFGPGTLHDIRVGVGFNPLEETADLAVDASARLSVPAHAELSLSIRAGAGLSAGIARITGGITGTGTVGLRGGFFGAIELHYRNSIYVITAEAAIRMRPVFRLGLDADVTAEIGAFGYVAARWQKVWNLYNFEWGANAEAGLIGRLRYATNEGLTLPSADNIEWIVPNIDAGAILADMFGGSRSSERDLN